MNRVRVSGNLRSLAGAVPDPARPLSLTAIEHTPFLTSSDLDRDS